MNLVDSMKNFCQLASAREFFYADLAEGEFTYEKNRLEKIGILLTWPACQNVDTALQRIREPHMIVTLTIAAMVSATIFFYPEECVEKIITALPFVSLIKPWAVKCALFCVSEITIFGFGMRTVGRLANDNLMKAWREKSIVAISIGSVIERAY